MTSNAQNLLNIIASYDMPVSFDFLQNETTFDITDCIWELVKLKKIERELTGSKLAYKIAK